MRESTRGQACTSSPKGARVQLTPGSVHMWERVNAVEVLETWQRANENGGKMGDAAVGAARSLAVDRRSGDLIPLYFSGGNLHTVHDCLVVCVWGAVC